MADQCWHFLEFSQLVSQQQEFLFIDSEDLQQDLSCHRLQGGFQAQGLEEPSHHPPSGQHISWRSLLDIPVCGCVLTPGGTR